MSEKFSKIWTPIAIGGAFTAYTIGAGFASGQEVIQYYGTWGGCWPFILPGISFFIIIFYCISHYRFGFLADYETPNEAFDYYCGKKLGAVVNIFVNLLVALTSLLMFAGCGSTLNQYLGIPIWVGAVGIGVAAAIVVCMGLEKVTSSLSFIGVVIIVIIIFSGIYCLATSKTGIMVSQQNIGTYVDEGIILQAQFFGLRHPLLAGIGYIATTVASGFTFNVALGQRCRSKKDTVGGAICAAIFFTLGTYFVLFMMLLNLDYIAENSAMVPILAAIENSIPILTLPYVIAVVLGIFTTITGYLWVVGRRFAKDGTTKQRIIVVIMVIFGMTVGTMIPLDELVNAIFPFLTLAGFIILIGIAYAYITHKPYAKTKETVSQETAPKEQQSTPCTAD